MHFISILFHIYTLQKYWSPYTVAQYKKETVCEEKVRDAWNRPCWWLYPIYQSVMDTSAVQTLMMGYTHTVLRPPCSHISQTSVVYTWFPMMNTYRDLGLTAAHLVKSYTGNVCVTIVLHILFKCGLWIFRTTFVVMFIYDKQGSIVLQLIAWRISHSNVWKLLYFVHRLILTKSQIIENKIYKYWRRL